VSFSLAGVILAVMNETSTPCRRWFGCKRRTLLVVFVAGIGMIWFAVWMEKARRQKAVVDEIVKRGGRVFYDWEHDRSRSEPPGPAWLRNLLGANFFARVAEVNLDDRWHLTAVRLPALGWSISRH